MLRHSEPQTSVREGMVPFTVMDRDHNLYTIERGPRNILIAVEKTPGRSSDGERASASPPLPSTIHSERYPTQHRSMLGSPEFDLEQHQQQRQLEIDRATHESDVLRLSLERKVTDLQRQLRAAYLQMDTHLETTSQHLTQIKTLQSTVEELRLENAELNEMVRKQDTEGRRKSWIADKDFGKLEEEKARMAMLHNEERQRYLERERILLEQLRQAEAALVASTDRAMAADAAMKDMTQQLRSATESRLAVDSRLGMTTMTLPLQPLAPTPETIVGRRSPVEASGSCPHCSRCPRCKPLASGDAKQEALLRRKLSEVEGRLYDSRTEFESRLADKDEIIKSMNKQMAELKEQVRHSESLVSTLNSQVVTLTSERKELSEKVLKLEREKETMTKLKDKAEEELENCLKALAIQKQDRNTETSALQKQAAHKDKEIETLTKHLTKLQADYDELKIVNQKLLQQQETDTAESERLRTQESELVKQVSTLTLQKKEYSDKVNALEQSVLPLQTQITIAERELASLRNIKKDLEERLASESAARTSEFNAARVKENQLTTRLADITNECTLSNERAESQQLKLDQATRRNAELEKALRDLESKLPELEKVEALARESQAKMQKLLDEAAVCEIELKE